MKATTDHTVNKQLDSRWQRFMHWTRWLLPITALLLVGYAVSHHFQQLDLINIHQTFKQVSLLNTVMLIVAGLFIASLNAGYDLLLSHWLKVDVDRSYVFRYAWLASAINNVAGFAGMTGAGIRYLALTHAGVSARQVVALVALVFLSMPVGLSILAAVVLLWHGELLSSLSAPKAISHIILLLVSLYGLLFLLIAGKGALHKRWLKDSPPLAFIQRLGLLAFSLLDWLMVSLLLWLCLWVVGVSVHFDDLLMAFTLAATLGVVSMVPGGLGVFEGSMLVLLGGITTQLESVMAALILFRVIYYFMPFLFALQLLPGAPLLREGSNLDGLFSRFQEHPLLRFGQIPLRFIGHISTRALSYFTFTVGLMLLLSAAFPTITTRIEALTPYFDLTLREGFHLSSVIAGTLLLGLSRGIRAGMKGAYHTTQIVVMIAIAVSLLKGLDYEEALLLIILSTVLAINKSEFQRIAYPLYSRHTLYWLLAGVLALLLAALLGDALYGSRHLFGQFNMFDHSQDAARYARALIVMLLTFLAWLGWTWYSMPFPPSMKIPDEKELQRAEKFYQNIACTGYSYLTFLRDKYLFYSKQNTALIQYGQKRNHLIVMGDPAAADSKSLAEGIREFRSEAEAYDRVAVFYQVDEDNLHHYLDAGFALLKLGEKARVDLQSFTLTGKKAQKLRTARNHGERDGLKFEILGQPLDEQIWQEIQAISNEWLNEKNAGEKSFSLGRFDRAFLSRAESIAVIRKKGRMLAFSSIVPSCKDTHEYSIDLMRHINDAPNGTMDFLFVKLMIHAQEAGFDWFDMGMAPLSGVGDSDWSRREERMIRMVYQYGNHFYNYKGLRDYKEKFHPQWRSIYLAYPRGRSLAAILLDVSALIAGGYRRVLGK